ncbi:lactococcin 972 family bacteriocin [Streptomyces hygroscopicus]|uniref:lactococcin 972 family bacteriocin n=1 Tax=Streptomyces hygroscopicus TaxID=1912 RepID=UPI001FCAA0C2|nr:lactococcin 972 family bacteriocin [Streptomyces hygroscopicus]
MKNGVKVAVAAGAIIMAAAAPALATTVDAGGGKWSYGAGAHTLWSNYKHPKVNHSSSVHGAYWSYSACTSPGAWSLASAQLGESGNAQHWDKGCKK